MLLPFEKLQHRLKELCIPNYEQLTKLWEQFFLLLNEANQELNLTRLNSPEAAILKHFLDSLAIYNVLREKMLHSQISSILDFGTGGGFPGIPLKTLFPKSRLTLVDARQKKLEFLKTAILQLGLNNVITVHDNWNPKKAITYARQQGTHDLCVARAVTDTVSLVRILLPLTKKFLILPKGPNLKPQELNNADNIARKNNFKSVEKIDFSLSFEQEIIDRSLLFWVKYDIIPPKEVVA